jgi:hypothetical protein
MLARRFAGLVCSGVLWSQSFHVPATTINKNGAAEFSILLNSPEGKAPVALQWEFRVPTALVMTAADVTVGQAAESRGKSVVCAAGGKGPVPKDGVRYTCILAGGINRIANGPVAVVHYRVESSAQRGRTQVAIESAKGVSLDLKSTAIADTTALITIR